MLEISQKPGEMGVRPNTLYTPPKFPHLWIYFMIKNCQIIFPKGVYRTPPENAFMNEYFYFYCVVKCGNRALDIHEQIKKSSWTQKRTQTHHCRKVIESPGTPCKMSESGIFGTLFLKMSVVRFLA
jgi:hypothetical protein